MKGFLCKIFNRRLSLTSRTVLFAALLSLLGSFGLFTFSASALEFDPDASFTGTFKTGTCYYRNAVVGENTYDDTFACNHGGKGNLGGFTIVSEQTLPKNSLLLIPITVQSFLNNGYDFNQFLAVSELSKASIYDLSSVQSGGYFGSNNNIHCDPNTTCEINVFENVLYLKVFIQEDTTSVRFQINSEGGFSITHPRTYNLIKLSSTSQSLDQINSDINQGFKDQTDAVNNQTQQDKDQYDQEKQEEADRENSAKDDGNSLLGIFNISLLNPFAGIWEIFNAGGCTAIPNIAAWTNSDDAVYCSWWPQSIRATLTPVFSLAAMMLLFGFVSRWLGGSEGIDVHGVKF